MSNSKIFRDFKPGDRCTHTVHMFNLNGPRLCEQGVIRRSGMEYFYNGQRSEESLRDDDCHEE